jgi:hypothetical protein
MKRLILLIILLSSSLSIFAKHVEEEYARKVGKAFFSKQANVQISKNSSLNLVFKENYFENLMSTSQERVFYYIFNIDSLGFIIVSGDDNVTPILGYSNEGTFNPSNIAQNTKKWLEEYKNQIRFVIENKIEATNEIKSNWEKLQSDKLDNFIEKSFVQPLIQTQWDQSPYYNSLCPANSVTGCVATAMAQIMKYWNYPATGSGFHSYNHQTYGTLSANFGSTNYQWNSMPNNVNSTNPAVATLMYHCGVSVDMNYSPQSSGAYVIENSPTPQACSEYALKTYFGYKNTLIGVKRVNYNQTQWINLLKNELDASRPILYAGFGSGSGHAFVCDGYDNNDWFHFNWGWGGMHDAYFQINALNPLGVGTGGGSGGYNTGHQAVIGIEPPAVNQTYNMVLNNYVTPSTNTIYYGEAFNISTNITNNGSNPFNGDYTVAIFDASNNFIDYVQTLTNYSLQGGYTYTNNLTFSTAGLYSMLPGTYYVGLYYRPTGGNWIQVANNGSYTNYAQIVVINPNDIELNSPIIVSPGTTLTQGQTASVNFNIVNDGVSTFYGQYKTVLYNLDGTFAQLIGTMNENNGLPSGYTYLSPYLTFNSSPITVAPGTYFLAVQHNLNNTGWQLTGSSYYQNPIYVTVVAASLQPDIYEVNNSLAQAYNLPVFFSGNNAINNTIGSNIHIGTDNDYYKIVLPSGYNYSISSRLHDSYNSGNGNIYSVDGLFSYSTDGTNWSNTFDDIMSGNINVSNGGTIYFRVAPYFSGETGTYLFDLNLIRTQNSSSGITENQLSDLIKVYPNPAKEYVTIDLNGYNGKVNQVDFLNIQGQIVNTLNLESSYEKIINTSLNNFLDGIYLIRIHSNDGILTKKIIINK